MLTSGKIYETMKQGSGFFQHGHPYVGHPAACAAGVTVLNEIEDRDLLLQVREKGAKLRWALEDAFGQHPHIGNICSYGLFPGLELVEDRATKASLEPARKTAARIEREATANGSMCYPMGGTIDGRLGDHVLLAPPFIIQDSDIDEIVTKLGGALERAMKN